MIQNDDGFKQARAELATLETDLASLRLELLPARSRRFSVLAEAYVDHISRLRREIDEYIGVSDLQAVQTGVSIRLIGPAIALGTTSASILANAILDFRKNIRAIAAAFHGERKVGAGRFKEEIERASDFILTGVASGSLQIAMNLPPERQLYFFEESPDPAKDAIDAFMSAAAWASVDVAPGDLESIIANLSHRRLILSKVLNMTPPERGPVEAVEFFGNLVHPPLPARLTRSSRIKLRRAVVDTSGGEYTEAVGVMREIDLDSRKFELRQRPGGEPDLPCIVVEEMLEDAKAALGARVLVSGTLQRRRRRKSPLLTVSSFEIQDPVPE